MLLIYSHKLTQRVQYIFKTIFTDVLKIQVSFTDDIEFFKETTSPKINYSNHKIADELFFQSSTILFETGIKEQDISITNFNNYPIFFATNKESTLPFDPFAASFYLITRYEEYLPHIRDHHDRFPIKESLAYQHNFLTIPLVNYWINELEEIIQDWFKTITIPTRRFQYLSTIDIDNAYAYKNKGILRNIAGLFKSIKTKDFNLRVNVLLGNEPDPYDTYDYLFEIHKKYNIEPIYFFLLADYAKNDKSISIKNKAFQALIKSISDYHTVGIHPSYSSNYNNYSLSKEIKRLKDITHKDINKSRQHFLKLNLPETYRRLIANDIEEDYTMGYAEEMGFRASICSPYYFYDLDTETESQLKIIPFSVMEASFQYYQELGIVETIQRINKIMDIVKNVKGTFVSVWHNESLSNQGIWKGWQDVYESMLQEAKNIKEKI